MFGYCCMCMVHCSLLVTGCYDGSVRLFDTAQLPQRGATAVSADKLALSIATGHSGPIKSLRVLQHSANGGVAHSVSGVQVVTASKDRTLRVWQVQAGCVIVMLCSSWLDCCVYYYSDAKWQRQ